MSEDVVTASFIDALRYANDARLLRAVLVGLARPWAHGSAIPDFDHFDVELWPSLHGREPDARIVLRRDDTVVCRLLLEAKLGAPKSGHGVTDEASHSGDQLSYYLRFESLDYPNIPVALLYLTHHASTPTIELQDSADELARLGRSDLIGQLFWASWRDVEHRLEVMSPRPPWLDDLLLLLQLVSMRRFTGFSFSGFSAPAQQMLTFYKGQSRSGYPDVLSTALGTFNGHWTYRQNYFALTELGALGRRDFYAGRS